MRKYLTVALLFLGLSLSGFVRSAFAQEGAQPSTPAAWPKIRFTPVTNGLQAPVYLTHAGDGSGRLFIVEQIGTIRIFQGQLLSVPFLDISGRVRSPFSNGGSEEGLLSVAFPPGYANKGYFYVYYTNKDGNNQVSRFHVGNNPNQANPNSEELILLLEHPNHSNHNGGQMVFGPDGYLYIGTGDGGGGGDPEGNAQNPGSLLGKLLRIDVEGNTVPTPTPTPNPTPTPIPPDKHAVYFPLLFTRGQAALAALATAPYSIPTDNPFVGKPSYRGEIWALGLRNPWRYSFDRQTGDLYLGDVGQNNWEEVDFQPASSHGGENYGWNILEGESCYGGSGCDKSGLTLPVFVYPTDVAGSCAVTGGFVYRGPSNPSMQGIYFFGDYCNGIVTGLQREGNTWAAQVLSDTNYNITSFGEDQSGELYVLDANGGVYRVEAAGTQ